MKDFLNKYLKGDKPLWCVFLMISVYAIIEIYSASGALVKGSADHTMPVTSHCRFLVGGAFLAFAIHHIRLRLIRVFGFISLAVAFFSLLFLWVGSGLDISIGGFTLLKVESINGASRWISVPFIQFQPSELAKIGMIICLSYFLGCPAKEFKLMRKWARFKNKSLDDENFVRQSKFWMSIILLAAFVLLILPDNLSTALLLGIVGFCIILISDINTKLLLKVSGGALIGLVLLGVILSHLDRSTLKSIHMERFLTWESRIESFSGGNDQSKYEYNDKTMQIVHSQIAVARGGFLGVGPGNSVERSYLPLPYADFIYAIVVEESGMIGAILVILFYFWILYRTGYIAKSCQKLYPSLMVYGLGIMLVFQAFISMEVVVHLGPVTGQPLPLFSRGGTSILITCIYIGIIQCVSRRSNEENAKKEAELAADKTEDNN